MRRTSANVASKPTMAFKVIPRGRSGSDFPSNDFNTTMIAMKNMRLEAQAAISHRHGIDLHHDRTGFKRCPGDDLLMREVRMPVRDSASCSSDPSGILMYESS